MSILGKNKIRQARGEYIAFLDAETIPHRQEQHAGLNIHRVDDPYEGEWFFVLLPRQFLGIYAPLADDLIEAVAEFAAPAPSQ